MSKQEIHDYLRDIGCCSFCCLRYLNGRGDEYQDVPKSLTDRGITVQPIAAPAEDAASDAEITAKRSRPNVCVACLDIFSERTQTETMRRIREAPTLQQYDIPSVLTSVSLPISLSVRALAIWIALLRRFPGGPFSRSEPPEVPLKEVVKTLVNPRVCAALGKAFDTTQSGMMVNVFYEHDDAEAEVRQLTEVNPKLFKNRSMTPRKFNREFLTRMAFERNFTPDQIDNDLFVRHVPSPPDSPPTAIRFDRCTLLGPTVFVAGRYRKLSRELCQSPWILHGKRVMDGSVSELIVDRVAGHFGVAVDAVVFSSSGREDVDVRCLGQGRPFALEVQDARSVVLPVEIAGQMERAIDGSGKVSVRHLQIVSRDDMKHIKTGEEDKTKIYRALCVLREPATREVLERLNCPDGFMIEQQTPLRVLHRRPLLTRPRRIHSVRALVDRSDARVLVVDVATQAGTYVKELVHGEFGRTTPSFRSLIGQWIDIVALDVMAVNLDWPTPVDNQASAKAAAE